MGYKLYLNANKVIVSQLWRVSSTIVARSFHNCGAFVYQMWNDDFIAVLR